MFPADFGNCRVHGAERNAPAPPALGIRSPRGAGALRFAPCTLRFFEFGDGQEEVRIQCLKAKCLKLFCPAGDVDEMCLNR